jgi:hypothetical protein
MATLMIALAPLVQWTQAGRLRNVAAGAACWVDDSQADGRQAAELAVLAPPSYSPVPPLLPPFTICGQAGLSAGVSNCSPEPSPVL